MWLLFWKKSFELLDYFFHICIQTNFLQDRKSWNYNKEKSECFLIVYHLEQLYNIKYNWHKACLESSWKHSVQRKYHFSAMPWSLLLNLLSVCQDELMRRKIRKNLTWFVVWLDFFHLKKIVLYINSPASPNLPQSCSLWTKFPQKVAQYSHNGQGILAAMVTEGSSWRFQGINTLFGPCLTQFFFSLKSTGESYKQGVRWDSLINRGSSAIKGHWNPWLPPCRAPSGKGNFIKTVALTTLAGNYNAGLIT